MNERQLNELLLRLIKNDPTLTSISFCRERDQPAKEDDVFDLKHLQYLINALAFNKTVKNLLIKDISLGIDGANAIKQLIMTNTTLTTLRIFNMTQAPTLGLDGLKIIFDALKTNINYTLKTLKLSDMIYRPEDEDKAIDLIIDLLKYNTTLNTLDFKGNSISLSGIKRLIEVIRKENFSIRAIILDAGDFINLHTDPAREQYVKLHHELDVLLARNYQTFKVRQAATILHQAAKDPNCFFKNHNIPHELLVKIASSAGQNEITVVDTYNTGQHNTYAMDEDVYLRQAYRIFDRSNK